jgi:RNA polymerase sigma-70 factor, ECF subfamily
MAIFLDQTAISLMILGGFGGLCGGKFVVERADNRTDEELVAAVNGGEWDAFNALYFRYRDWTFRLAWRFSGSEADAQDVVQEVFTYLARKLRTGLELRAGMTTLLYPAVKHTALAMKRKGRKTVALGEDWGEEGAGLGQVPGRDQGGAETQREYWRRVLRGLNEGQREVLLMRFVDDMSQEEIGGALGIPVGTVKSRLHHALAALREDERLREFFEE